MSQRMPLTQAHLPYVEPEAFARLGHTPQPHQPKDTWQFNVIDFVPNVNPNNYFCTSGEAVIKAKKLEQDLWQAAAAARRFTNVLIKTRGKHKYLEFQITGDRYQDGRQMSVVKTKDPRPNQRLIAKQRSRI
jgi:hypothetical protein